MIKPIKHFSSKHFSNTLCGTVSKALAKSKNMVKIFSPKFKLKMQKTYFYPNQLSICNFINNNYYFLLCTYQETANYITETFLCKLNRPITIYCKRYVVHTFGNILHLPSI